MTEQEIDGTLGGPEDAILPSSGFFEAVMSRVESEAAAPPAIPFPWRRALPGLVVTAVALAALLATVVLAWQAISPRPISSPLLQTACLATAHALHQPGPLSLLAAMLVLVLLFAGLERLGSMR